MSKRGRANAPESPPILDRMDDYTVRAKEFRERYFQQGAIRQVIEHLRNDRRHVHPLLVGRDGVGRRFVVQGMAKQLAESTDPRDRQIRICACTLALFIEGTQYRGQDREKLVRLVEEVGKSRFREVLFLDNIHLTVGAGATREDTRGDLASGLQEFLTERGPLQLIGATTPEGFRFMLGRNEAFANRFTRVGVPDLPEDLSVELLKDYVATYEEAWQEAFDEDLYRKIFHYGQRLLPHRAPPGCGVDLLREMLNEKVHLKSQIQGKQEAEAWLFRAITRRTGMQRIMFDETLPLTLKDVEAAFRKAYFGQDEAVRAACRVILRKKAGMTPPDRPSGVFLLAGPTGVGKTELGRCMARYLYDDVRRMRIVDMAEFCEVEAVEDLRRRIVGQFSTDPYTLLLLDEVEKACLAAHHILLAATGDGRLTDEQGRTADLRQGMILMTTNAGSHLYGQAPAPDREALTAELRKVFAPEFLNRIEHILFFEPLSQQVCRQIVEKELRLALTGRAGTDVHKIDVKWTDEVADWITERGFDPVFGARSLQRAIEREIVFPLSERMAACEVPTGSACCLRIENDQIQIEIQRPG